MVKAKMNASTSVIGSTTLSKPRRKSVTIGSGLMNKIGSTSRSKKFETEKMAAGILVSRTRMRMRDVGCGNVAAAATASVPTVPESLFADEVDEVAATAEAWSCSVMDTGVMPPSPMTEGSLVLSLP